MYSGLKNRTITLQHIYENWETYQDQFETYQLPPFRQMEDGRYCIQTFARVTDMTSGGEWVAFVFLDKDRKFIEESTYTFADLPKEGYLIRYSVPTRCASSDTIEMDYVVDINNLPIIETMVNSESSFLQIERSVSINKIHEDEYGEFILEDIIWDPIVSEYGLPDTNERIFEQFFKEHIS